MRKKILPFLPCILIVVLVAGWIALVIYEEKRLSPAADVNTLQEFADTMPQPRRLALVETLRRLRRTTPIFVRSAAL